MELLKELQKYNEDLTIKEVVAQIGEKDEINRKFKGKFLKTKDDCEFFGKLLQVVKVENLKQSVEGKYQIYGECVSIRESSTYLGESSSYLYSVGELEKMQVITENEYKVYVALHESIKQQLEVIWTK